MLGDWLGGGRPGAEARGHQRGDAGALAGRGAPALQGAIDAGTLAGLRDRALVSVMLYSFARVSAAIGMRRSGLLPAGEPGVAEAAREGGRRHDVPGSPPGSRGA